MMRFSIVKQNRFRTLVCEGYRYSRYMVVYNKEYWRCTDRSCKGKLHLSGGRIVYVKKNGHSHGPDHKGISAGQALFVIQRKKARNREVPFEQIYEETVREFEELGHGPMREMLPYDEVVWKIYKQLPGGVEVQSPNDAGTVFEVNCDAEGRQRNITDTVNEDEKPDISCVEESTAVRQSLPSTNSVASILTRPLISIMPTSQTLASQNTSDHITCSPSALQTASITSPRSRQDISSDSLRGLKIQSTFSLQSESLQNASHFNQQDMVQRFESGSPNTDVNLHSVSSASVSHQHSSSRYRGPVQSTTCVGTQRVGGQRLDLSICNTLQSSASVPNSNAFLTSNHLERQNKSSTGARNPPAQPTSPRRLTTTIPRTARLVVGQNAQEQGSSSPNNAYTQLQMQHARKEHRLRIQHMKERHNAEMVLVHLQQELVREQLREIRQPTSAINT